MRKIRYYGNNDLSNGVQLKEIYKVIEKLKNGNTDSFNDINDIIELYNIELFFKSGLLNENISPFSADTLKVTRKKLKQILGTYFNTKLLKNIECISSEVDFIYKEQFWQLIEIYNLHNNISSDLFVTLIESNSTSLFCILMCEKIVKHFDKEVKNIILLNPKSSEYIVKHYKDINQHNKKPLFLPESFTNEDLNKLFLDYIKSDDVNINYLNMIMYFNTQSRFIIGDLTKLRAKQRITKENERLFPNGGRVSHEFIVVVDKSQSEPVYNKFTNNKIICKLGGKWIDENLDYNTLLNNFIYMLELVDNQFRIADVNKISEMGNIEKLIMNNMVNNYNFGASYIYKNNFSNLKFQAYYDYLLYKGIRLEDIIEWFFNDYLSEELSAGGFSIAMPSAEMTPYQKCISIFPAFDSIIKQFELYVDNGSVDHELLNITSKAPRFQSVRSLLEKKYIYSNNDKVTRITHDLFSNQCMLSYNERLKISANSFYDLLHSEIVMYHDYMNFGIEEINWLVEENILKNENGILKLSNIVLSQVLWQLYYNDVINYPHCTVAQKEIIDELLNNGLLISDATLLSKPESSYFNYHLNKSSFDNSLELRNKYLHGGQTNINDSEHTLNYFIALKLIIFLIININDEFCLNNEIKGR